MTATLGQRETATEPSAFGRRPRRVSISDLSHHYRSSAGIVPALEHVELVIEPGEFVTIVGPSGCGKTTLLRAIAGFLTPAEGAVFLDGEPVRGPGRERGVVFQQPTLFPWLTVRGNVELGPRLRRVPRRQAREQAERYLELVGLAQFARSRTWELSGGMQQRCAIARALANDPEIVLADEPFGALDALTRERMQEELLRIWQRTGKTIVFITHSVEEALYLGTRVVVMSPRPGRVAFDAPVPIRTDGEHAEDLRVTPAFVELRAAVDSVIRSESAISST